MGVQLNIKSEEAHALASKIAEAEGISLTQAVVEALRRRERDLEKNSRFQRAVEISKAAAARMSPELLAMDIDDYLYDEFGMPK
jgi:hypothetical protein